MDCKNCKSELNPQNNYCKECGAKIVRERTTIKSLLSDLLDAFGWDSNFIVTLRHLLYKPQIVFKEYINGTRKKYANPFTFFAISLAISLFVFNQYSEQYIQLSTTLNLQQVDENEGVSLSDKTSENKGLKALGFESQEELNKSIVMFQLKYYNLISFLSLPLFTLISFLVFRKPYNYGEHLIINTYILSIITFLGIILLLFSLLTEINIFLSGSYVTLLYFPYVYKKLYELSFGQIVLKILKLIGIILLLIIISAIIIGIIGFITK